jgi:hypothetical protein
MRNFEREVETIGDKIKPLTKHFSTASELNMKSSLQPALKTGAKKGTAAAIFSTPATMDCTGLLIRRLPEDKV